MNLIRLWDWLRGTPVHTDTGVNHLDDAWLQDEERRQAKEVRDRLDRVEERLWEIKTRRDRTRKRESRD